MNVRHVRMSMLDRLVHVGVSMRLSRACAFPMRVLVMGVVHVRVVVLERFVEVEMLVFGGEQRGRA